MIMLATASAGFDGTARRRRTRSLKPNTLSWHSDKETADATHVVRMTRRILGLKDGHVFFEQGALHDVE